MRTVERFEDKPARAAVIIGFDPAEGSVDVVAHFRLGGFAFPARPCASYRDALERTLAYIERQKYDGSSGVIRALQDRIDDLKQAKLFE